MKKLLTLIALLTLTVANSQVNKITNFQNNNALTNFNTSRVATIGNKYVFTADDGINGEEIWITNGSESGTRMLADLNTGSKSTEMFNFTSTSDKVFFIADGDGLGLELWCTDGTTTSITKDLGPGSSFFSSFNQIVSYKDNVYVAAYTSSMGEELWMSDGTESGTKILKDIVPGSSSFSPQSAFVFNDLLYFFGSRSSFDPYELWSSDGTSSGTQKVVSLDENGDTNLPTALATDGETIYFALQNGFDDDLWISDGTESGTKYITSLSTSVNSIIVTDGKAYFSDNDSDDIWVSDGTSEGTKVLRDFSSPGFPPAPYSLTVFKDNVYFMAQDGGDLFLWKINPEDDSLNSISEFSSSTTSIWQGIINLQDELLIVAGKEFELGIEIYKSQGTEKTTEILVDLNMDYSDSSKPVDFRITEAGDVIFKAQSEGNNRELFIYKKSNYVPFSSTIDIASQFICNGDSAVLEVNVEEGTQPYEYSWDYNGETGKSISVASGGSYSVTVVDANGEMVISHIELQDPPSMIVSNATIVNETGSNSDGSIAVDISGGAPSYTYLWNTGANTSSIDNLSADTYTLTVTDSLGCERTFSYVVDQVSSTKDIAFNIKISPTLVRDYLHIDSEIDMTNWSYQIISLNGTVIIDDYPITNENSINVTHLESGIYFLKLINDSSKRSIKFVKY